MSEALRLADALDERRVTRWVHSTGETPMAIGHAVDAECARAAAELRRLHAEVEALRTALAEPECGCYMDLGEGDAPDGCVIDAGRLNDCIYARKYGSKGREHCGEWRPIKVVKRTEPVTLTAEEIGGLWRNWVGPGRPNYSFAHSVIAAYQAKQEGKV